MGEVQNLRFGDLVLDETCLFAHRNGQTIRFTRSERALLRAFCANPRRLMTRSRLLDEIASSESDTSDRSIDFLINRLRAKLGDNAKSPIYIATQYGEGYSWIASPSRAAPIDGFLVVGAALGLEAHPFSRQASALVSKLRDMIAARIGAGRRVVVVENGHPAATDKLRYFLQLSFHPEKGGLKCAATLREMPSKRIVRTFRLHLDTADTTSLTSEATRISNGVIGALQQALRDATSGLGIAADEQIEVRLQRASTLLSSSNPKWLASGERLRLRRKQDPLDADAALQWCLHLFSRLVLTSPFRGMSLEERDRLEGEIEATVLECLPRIEENPLLMLTAAKLLYFTDRGHLDLAEDIAERAFARTADFAAALPVIGQLRYARGRLDEAIGFFDQGIRMAEPSSEFLRHMRVLKCVALLAAGSCPVAAAACADLDDLGPDCPPELALAIGVMAASTDRRLPAASEHALAVIGPVGAGRAIEYLYFTSARQLVSEHARANLMHGMITHVSRLHGPRAVPGFVLRNIGLAAAA